MLGAGLLVRQNLVWVKSSLVLGRSDYQYRHEPILYGLAAGESGHEPILYGFVPAASGRLGRGGPRWFGDNCQTTVFEVDKPSRSSEHPTMKPVALIEAMIANSLPPRGVLFDPFAGSGSTLIAAYKRGCSALVVELDPRYADVILRRFEAHSGIVPTLDGKPVSFMADAVSV